MLFQKYHDGRALTVGGYADEFSLDTARLQEERGLVQWVEDEPQQGWPRVEHPDVGETDDALARVREAAFDGGRRTADRRRATG
jgi:hypothetical protein